MQQPPPGYVPQQPGYGPQGQMPGGYPGGYPPPQQRKGMGVAAKILIALFVMSALGVGGCILCVGGFAKSVSDQVDKEKAAFDAQPVIKVTAVDLVAAYKKNAVAADTTYEGKKLRVTGSIQAIDSSIGDTPVVRLAGGEMFSSVSLTGLSKSAAGALQKNTSLTVTCKGAGAVMNMPMLSNCKL